MKSYILLLAATLSCTVPIKGIIKCMGEDGKLSFCEDKDFHTIPYCCEKEEGGENTCCEYTAFWTLWYFWVGFFLGLATLATLLSASYRIYGYKKRERTQTRREDCHTSSAPSCLTDRPTELPQTQFQNMIELEEQPPSYQDIEKQGINENFRRYSLHGLVADDVSLDEKQGM